MSDPQDILEKIKPFDVAAAVGADPNSANYSKVRAQLTMQLLSFIIGRLVMDNPSLQTKIEEYTQDFIKRVKNEH